MSKWEVTGLLDNLSGTYKEILSEVLDNCYNEMINDTEKDSEFSSIVFPLVRRIFDEDGSKMDYFKAKNYYLKVKKEILNDYQMKNQKWKFLLKDEDDQLELVEALTAIYIGSIPAWNFNRKEYIMF